MSWTDERVELLRKLWLEGLSASQIAGELANGITRNAVIGKVHRLGLSGRVKAQVAPSTEVRLKQPQRPMMTRPSGSVIRGNTALALKAEPYEFLAPKPIENIVIPISEHVTIMDLKEIHVPLAAWRPDVCRVPLLRRQEDDGDGRALLRLSHPHGLSARAGTPARP